MEHAATAHVCNSRTGYSIQLMQQKFEYLVKGLPSSLDILLYREPGSNSIVGSVP